MALARTVLTGVVLLAAPNAGAQEASPPIPARGAAPVAITGVTVIDVVGGRRRRDRTVVIRGTRIVVEGASARVRVPTGALHVDGRGKFLIPGLWDMHVHALPKDTRPRALETSFPLFVANGVTGVREMGSWLDTLRAVRAGSRLTAHIAPRMIAAGAPIDGPERSVDFMLAAASSADGRRLVDSVADAGADFVKVYNFLRKDVYAAVADEAARRHLPLAGHVPMELSALEAAAAGQRSLEHLIDLPASCASNESALRAGRSAALAGGGIRTAQDFTRMRRAEEDSAAAHFDASRCRAVLRRLARSDTWLCPTLAVKAAAGDPARVSDPRLRFIEPEARANAGLVRPLRAGDTAEVAARRRALIPALRLVREASLAGVPLLAGTDLPNAYLLPGFSLHEELQLLVRAGLTPAAALRAATWEPARFLGATDSLGTVSPGKLADLVLLDADPLTDIAHTTHIRAVVLNGRYLDRPALDALLASAERAASGSASR